MHPKLMDIFYLLDIPYLVDICLLNVVSGCWRFGRLLTRHYYLCNILQDTSVLLSSVRLLLDVPTSKSTS